MKVTMSPSPLFSKINQLIKMATIKDYYGVTHITMRPAKIQVCFRNHSFLSTCGVCVTGEVQCAPPPTRKLTRTPPFNVLHDLKVGSFFLSNILAFLSFLTSQHKRKHCEEHNPFLDSQGMFAMLDHH